MSDIEFLPDEDVPHDGPDREPRRRRPALRGRVVLVAVVLILAAGGAIAWHIGRPEPRSGGPIGRPALGAASTACGGAARCTVSTDVPTAVIAALRSAFGSVTDPAVVTEVAATVDGHRAHLSYRSISARVPGGHVDIRITPYVKNDSSYHIVAATTSVRRVVHGYAVVVQFTGGGSTDGSVAVRFAGLVSVALDRRLESI